MKLEKFFSELDKLFAQKQVTEVENFLICHLEKAKTSGDAGYQLAVLNEQIGYYRILNRTPLALAACEQAMAIISSPDMAKNISAATTMLNVATAMRAAGKISDALKLYDKVEKLYASRLKANDVRQATLFNNMAQALVANGQTETALEYLYKSQSILEKSQKNSAELAANHSNIASVYISLGKYETAETHLQTAIPVFENFGHDDIHYPAALSAMATVMYGKKDYSKAIDYYQRALKKNEELLGQNGDYARICRNCAKVYTATGMVKEAEELLQKAQAIAENLNSSGWRP